MNASTLEEAAPFGLPASARTSGKMAALTTTPETAEEKKDRIERERIAAISVTPLADMEPGSWEWSILHGLQSKEVYMGTVDPVTISERRARNKVARRSRRINRRR